MANKWIRIACGMNQPLVVAPAELALDWPGSRSTGEVDIYLTYWQELMDDLRKAHPDLAWRGHKDTPFVRTKSQADAKAVLDKLTAFMSAKFPTLKIKKQKERMQYHVGEDYHLATMMPVAASDTLLEAGEGKDEWTAKGTLLWRATVHYGGVRARITDEGGLLLVDSEAADNALDATIKGKPTAHGSWRFDSGLAVVHWAPTSISECKGLESGKLSAIEAVVAKKPAASVKVNVKDAGGGAAVFKLAPGTYQIETGGDESKARWLRVAK